MTPTLEHLNRCSWPEYMATLEGLYEHSPWVVERAATSRPFGSVVAFKLALQQAVFDATHEENLDLIRAHPDLAGKAAIAGGLSVASADEQCLVGLNHCTPEEFSRLNALNAAYHKKFGFPFVLAIKGPDGNGLKRETILDTFVRRLANPVFEEFAESLRQIHRIAELRLNAVLSILPGVGYLMMARADVLAQWSDDPHRLTCSFMREAHRRTAAQLAQWMLEAGMTVEVDALANVSGKYLADDPQARTFMIGSHYDTVRNGGKYDGRAGILLGIEAVRRLNAANEKLPYHLEVIGFSEEEGVRFSSTFLGSSAVAGQFDPALLEQTDGDGTSMRDAIVDAGYDPAAIAAIARDPATIAGYLEIHIEQGPVLLNRGLPVGIVSSIAGSCRYLLDLTGMAGHAGTTPMSLRRDAAAAAAEIVLYVERRCRFGKNGESEEEVGLAGLVGTVGKLNVPDGSVNVVPGACHLSLDVRAANDACRDQAVDDILEAVASICSRRGVEWRSTLLMRAAAVPCAPKLVGRLTTAVEAAGIPPFFLPSGAGHDAMMLATITNVGMLFMRCGNGGLSHNPLETMTADDAEVSAQILLDFLRQLPVDL